MAKMFYTLEEAAQKLNVTEAQIKEMAGSGKLQQFRDRDKLMFKREQIDAMSGGPSPGEDTGGPIPLANSGDTDAINLSDEAKAAPPRKEDPRSATGVSVFDASEVEHADPMAQTQVSTPAVDQEQLALESVGSGSGLLDLTRESDDTSLGAELLDEIYPGGPGGGEGSDAKVGSSVPGSSGVFDGAIAIESGASGLENLQPTEAAASSMVTMVGAEEVYDPTGSGMSAGALLGATVALVLGLSIAISGLAGVPSKLVVSMSASSGTVFMYAGGLLVLSLVGALAGFFIGRMQAR